MNVNKQIVVAGILLIAVGAYQAFLMNNISGPHAQPHSRTLTRIVVGGYLVAVIASIVDVLSPGAGYLAGLIMMLAVGTALLVIIPDLAQRLSGRQQQQAKGA